MHILEFIKSKETTVPASEIIYNEICHLLARMHDFKQSLTSKEQQKTIESMRNDLTFIRHAVDIVLKSKEE